MLSMYFRYFVINNPWKRVGSFIWTILNSLHPRMFCAKFGCNWPSGSGKRRFLNFVNVFSLFRFNFTLKNVGRLVWTNLITNKQTNKQNIALLRRFSAFCEILTFDWLLDDIIQSTIPYVTIKCKEK